jgi:hypothetical protein
VKRNELQAGVAYAYNRGQEGAHSMYCERVVVIDTNPHEEHRYTGKVRPVKNGNGVLVKKVSFFNRNENEQNYTETVVQLRHIVELWETYEPRREQMKIQRSYIEMKLEEAQTYKETVVYPKAEQVARILSERTNQRVSDYKMRELDEAVLEYLLEVLK